MRLVSKTESPKKANSVRKRSIAGKPPRPFTYEMKVSDPPTLPGSIWLLVRSAFRQDNSIGEINIMNRDIRNYAIDPDISQDQVNLNKKYVRCFEAVIPDLRLRKAWDRTVGQPWEEPVEGLAGTNRTALDKYWNERWGSFQAAMRELVREASVDLHITLAAPPSPSIPALLEMVCQRFFAEPITSTPHGILIPYSGKMLWHSRPLTFEEYYGISKTE
jgi:hypothetical protein